MIETLAIVLGVAIAVLAVVLGGTVLWARNETIVRVSVQEDKLLQERKCLDLEDARDAALAGQKKAELERDAANAAAKVHEEEARRAREELTKHVQTILVTGSDDDVAAEVDRLLGAVPSP